MFVFVTRLLNVLIIFHMIVFHLEVSAIVDQPSVLVLERKLKHHGHTSQHHSQTLGHKKQSNAVKRNHGNGKELSLKSTSFAYVTKLSVGNPPQKLDFLIDTGSANTALAGHSCVDQFGKKCKVDAFYQPKQSKTSLNLHTQVEAKYGKGAWSGELYKDVISFPGGSPRTVAMFAVINHQRDFFVKKSINQGILGLAYKALASDGIEPLLDQLVKDKKTPNVFTIALCNGMGKLWLGTPDSSSFVGKLQHTRLLTNTWYTVEVTGVDVAGNRIDLGLDSFPNAVVDSGTTDILLHPEAYIAVVAELKETGPSVDDRFWNGFCVKTDPFEWPYLTIYLRNIRGGSFAITVLGKHYIRKQDEFYCLSIGAKQSGVVLGEVALEGNVVVFDRENRRLGFAPSNITHPKGGLCGNPVSINTSVSGELSSFCEETYMPSESCHSHCRPCVRHGGAWCPNGYVVVWINGVKSYLQTHTGFCWRGNAFQFHNTTIPTFLNGHGSAEFQISCRALFPMYQQCVVDGAALFSVISAAVFLSVTLLGCVIYRKVLFSKTVGY